MLLDTFAYVSIPCKCMPLDDKCLDKVQPVNGGVSFRSGQIRSDFRLQREHETLRLFDVDPMFLVRRSFASTGGGENPKCAYPQRVSSLLLRCLFRLQQKRATYYSA